MCDFADFNGYNLCSCQLKAYMDEVNSPPSTPSLINPAEEAGPWYDIRHVFYTIHNRDDIHFRQSKFFCHQCFFQTTQTVVSIF